MWKSSRLKHFPSSSPTWLFLNSGLLPALVFFHPRKTGGTTPVTSPPCCLSLQKRLQIPANSVTPSPLQCLHLGPHSTPFSSASRHFFPSPVLRNGEKHKSSFKVNQERKSTKFCFPTVVCGSHFFRSKKKVKPKEGASSSPRQKAWRESMPHLLSVPCLLLRPTDSFPHSPRPQVLVQPLC